MKRRRAHRQRVHDLLHGGQHRLDGVDARDAVDQDHWGWHAAFAVCCGGMLLAILNFMLMHRTLAHVGSLPDDQPIRWKRLGAVALGGVEPR